MVADRGGAFASAARRFRHHVAREVPRSTSTILELDRAGRWVCFGLRSRSGHYVSGRSGRAVSVRKTEAIVNY